MKLAFVATLMATSSAIDISSSNNLKQGSEMESMTHMTTEQQTEMKAQIDEAI